MTSNNKWYDQNDKQLNTSNVQDDVEDSISH